MTSNWLSLGVIMLDIKYVEWRKGVAYYRRRIPNNIQNIYQTGSKRKSHEFFSLKTRAFDEAAVLAQRHTDRLDKEWGILSSDTSQSLRERARAGALLQRLGIRLGEANLPDRCDPVLEKHTDEFIEDLYDERDPRGQLDYRNLPEHGRIAFELAYGTPEEIKKHTTPTFSQCVEKYLYFNPDRNHDEQFHRSVRLFMDLSGDQAIDSYKRADAHKFVEAILKRGSKSATVKRYCAQVRPVFNVAITELEVAMSNPFAKITIPNLNEDATERRPFGFAQIKKIQERCLEMGDDKRLLIALLSDTGMRLSEAVGLYTSDLCVDADYPYLNIVKNDLRRIKTPGSIRRVPLVGAALDSSKVLLASRPEGPLFPTFVTKEGTKANSLSYSLKKWLLSEELCTKDLSLHSFRHSLRDRLRNAGVPSDAANRIGGWANAGVGEGYGRGHDLSVLFKYMQQMIEYEQQK